jgi:gentisate 1,2-dioxygenase
MSLNETRVTAMIDEELAGGAIDPRKLQELNLRPLWTEAVNAVTKEAPGQPRRRAIPTLWRYRAVREELLRAGAVVTVDQAERRVLVLVNPGHTSAEGISADSAIFVGAQLVLPGEPTSCHRHSPGAARFVVEGAHASTIVNGERLRMEPGDLILTPPHHWHEHIHEGKEPVIWLDILDIPVSGTVDAIYFERGVRTAPEDMANENRSYQVPGVVPYRSPLAMPRRYPLLRYRWIDVHETLVSLAACVNGADQLHLMYVNPETGTSALEPYCFSVRMLRPAEEIRLKLTSASSIFHVIDGEGESQIADLSLSWESGDVMAAPSQTAVRHRNRSPKRPAFLLQVDNSPLQHKLGWYREFS